MKIISSIINLLSKRILQIVNQRNLKKLCYNGYNLFLKTGQTPNDAFLALIKLYCETNGRFSVEFNKRLVKQSKVVESQLKGVPGIFNAIDFEKTDLELNKNGYTVFDKKLDKEFCDRLYMFAMETPLEFPPNYKTKILYNPENPIAEIYRFNIQDIVNNLDVQNLIMDPVLINIARNYLGGEPIFDFPAMWWSTAFKKTASSEAAQLYHFDMDRVKWLKVFFYINDVTPENGPHCYIKGSHKPGNKPIELLKRGYARIPDSDLNRYYKEIDFIQLYGKAGTMFAGDTKCWHKGLHPKAGHRLVLEFEYTSSLFGANRPKLIVQKSSVAFREFCKRQKVYSSNIDFAA